MHRNSGRLAARACSLIMHERLNIPMYATATASGWRDGLPAAGQQPQQLHAASLGCPMLWAPVQQGSSAPELSTTRAFASATDQLSEQQYHRAAEETLNALLEDLEAVIDDRGLEGADLEYGQGVLTLSLLGKGTYVMNKQAPNQQIWLSSPISGPVRYDFKGGKWVYTRDGHLMHDRLETEFGELMGGPISLSRPRL